MGCSASVAPLDAIPREKALNPKFITESSRKLEPILSKRPIHQRYASMSQKEKIEDIKQRNKFIRRMSTRIHHKIGASWAGGLDNFPEGIIIINSDGIILHTNTTANDIFDMNTEDTDSRNIMTLIPHKFFGKYLIKEEKKVPDDLSTDNILELETVTLTGSVIYVNISFTQIEPKIKDEYYGYLVFIRNVTEKKLLEMAMAEAHKRNEDLLASLLPAPILERLRAGEKDIITLHRGVVAFCDIKGSTEKSKTASPVEIAKLKCTLFRQLDKLVGELAVTKIETAGDCYMVACGLFGEVEAGDKIIKFGQRALAYASEELKVDMRCGAHYGEVASCVAGDILPHFHLSGETVNKASRLESMGKPNKIHISEELYKILSRPDNYPINLPNITVLKDYGPTTTYFIEIT
ncbi:MAG: response regulator [Harvfovirus sp.]|uniref:Response regulator n=1 Tax=Harvfovirus sp. TaxID=2487768 RepID=A0A3G5A2G3_9VIRU|nr:MAG: response regulator [Harvfovirus sp.]